MDEYSLDERRICAPAESSESVNEGYPQLTICNTGWTESEREQMRIHGFDGMDMLRIWLS